MKKHAHSIYDYDKKGRKWECYIISVKTRLIELRERCTGVLGSRGGSDFFMRLFGLSWEISLENLLQSFD